MINRRWFVLSVVIMLLGAACGSNDSTDQGTEVQEEAEGAPSAVTLRAAPNDPEDPNIAVLEFLPEKVAVMTGAEVTWTFSGPEPHSVSFFPQGQTPPPPGSDPTLHVGKEPSGPVDGTTLLNSGLRPAGPAAPEPFTLTFDKAGTFGYVCVIHPLMTGEITVADDEAAADTQAEITSRGDEELGRWLEDGRAAKKKLLAEAIKTTKEGNLTVHSVGMGATTEHTDILTFVPLEAGIKAGDKVVFVNNSGAPHTATFAGGTEVPQNPESPEAVAAAPGKSPQTLKKTGFYNSGWLPPNAPPGAGPPEAARSFTFVVPEAGEYAYTCLLHAPSGMVGVVKVA